MGKNMSEEHTLNIWCIHFQHSPKIGNQWQNSLKIFDLKHPDLHPQQKCNVSLGCSWYVSCICRTWQHWENTEEIFPWYCGSTGKKQVYYKSLEIRKNSLWLKFFEQKKSIFSYGWCSRNIRITLQEKH